MEILLLTSILVLSLAGIAVTYMVTYARSSERELYSAFGFSCSSFTEHPLFRFFKVPLDLWGGVYYIFILAFTAGAWVWGMPFWGLLFFSLVFGSLFSLYSIMIQVITVRNFCEWTLVAAFVPIMNLGLFLLLAPVFKVADWITVTYDQLFLLATIFSAAGAVLAVFSFFTFLSFMDDLRISAWEAKVLSSLSEGIWLAVVGVLGLGVGVIWVNGNFVEMQVLSLMLGVTTVAAVCEFTKISRIRPALVMLSLQKNENKKEERELLKRLSFGVEAIALISWLCVAFFFILPMEIFFISQAAGTYVLLVTIAFLLSQLIIPNQYNDEK